jgi:type VI secretion system secreted protein Hcp
MAQVDYFLKLDGIQGESQDDKHKNEIELVSFNVGVVQSGTGGQGSGQGAGKAQAHDFHCVKRVDKASPVLYIACCTGQHLKSAVLVARKAGGGQQEYYKLTMEDVLVSSYNTSGASESDIVPTEEISLNFVALDYSYKEQKPDGSLGGEVKQKYNFSKNVKQ